MKPYLEQTDNQQDNHWWRAINVQRNEDITLEDRYVLACLVRGLNRKGNKSKISLDTICRLCTYIDTNGNRHPYGRTKLDRALNRLQAAGKIEIIKPELGECTKYIVHGLKSYEKIPDAFFYLPYSPEQKGYILFMLQHNLDKTNGQPNSKYARCAYNENDWSDKAHVDYGKIKKIEKPLIQDDIVSIVPTTKRDEETGCIIIERKLDLEKINMGSFILQVATNLGNQIEDVNERMDSFESDYVSKKDLKKYIKEAFKEIKNEL